MSLLNEFGKKLMKKFSYTIGSNLLSLGISMLVVVLVPKIIGVEEYGYWQLYLFYTTYVGILHFGWLDGIYLKLGGADYRKIDKDNLFSQFFLFLIFQIIISVIFFYSMSILDFSKNKQIVIKYISYFITINNTRFLLMYILQVTSQVREYALMITLDRISYFILLIGLITIGIEDFNILILVDLIGKIFSLMLGMYYCKEIVFRIQRINLGVIKDIKDNIAAGIKLMLSNITNSLIIGISRFGVESNWSIVSFAKVSLALNLSSIVFVFINALGIVIYPLLKKINKESMYYFYKSITIALNLFLFLLLFAFFPLKFFLINWLPDYTQSIVYLSIIFPMIISESKMLLVVNNIYATFRLEKTLLLVNVWILILSSIITAVSIVLFESILLLVVGIPFVLLIRYYVLDYLLIKKISKSKRVIFPIDIIFVISFIVTQQFLNDLLSALILLFIYTLYLKVYKMEIKESINYIKKILF